MQHFAGLLEAVLNVFAQRQGRSVWVLRDALARSPFDFERRRRGCEREYFGLGLHILVSRPTRSSSGQKAGQ